MSEAHSFSSLPVILVILCTVVHCDITSLSTHSPMYSGPSFLENYFHTMTGSEVITFIAHKNIQAKWLADKSLTAFKL